MSGWQDYFEQEFPIALAPAAVMDPTAAAMVSMLGGGAYGGATLVAVRRSDEGRELLILDVAVELGQRKLANDIRLVERIAVKFGLPKFLPLAFPMRDGFPKDVPHLNLCPDAQPRSLCLFEMPSDEAIRIVTPFIYLERVRFWLRETAYGRLHGDDQPLDPIFLGRSQAVILPKTVENAEYSGVFFGYRSGDNPGVPAILGHAEVVEGVGRSHLRNGFTAIILKTKPLAHARIRMLPSNMDELLQTFGDLGIDLLPDLKSSFRAWLSKTNLHVLLEQTCLVVVDTPIERSPGVIGGHAVKGFITSCNAEALAAALGALWKVGTHVSYPLGVSPPDRTKLQALGILPADLYQPFDRETAQIASGLDAARDHSCAVALIGVGALGSQVAMVAGRMGIGKWTFVDPDHLLPHNMGRHALPSRYVGWAKAEAMAREFNTLLGPGSATHVVAKADESDEAQAALDAAATVIDASASVPVARWLASRSTHQARTASVFLNPAGTDLVVLREGIDRQPRLDHVEMCYYWMLSGNPDLETHLANQKVGLYPSGGCRRPSLALSQARIASLAPLATTRLLEDEAASDGTIELWRTSPDGVAAVRSIACRFFETTLDGWQVAISSDVVAAVIKARADAGSLETGGILVGTWDRINKKVYVVGNYDPPPDSVGTPTGFVRGSLGVYRTIEAVESCTGTNLTYIGEWHTHPKGFRSRPSQDDKVVLQWIQRVLVYSDVPPLMMIGGSDGVRVLIGTAKNSILLATGNR